MEKNKPGSLLNSRNLPGTVDPKTGSAIDHYKNPDWYSRPETIVGPTDTCSLVPTALCAAKEKRKCGMTRWMRKSLLEQYLHSCRFIYVTKQGMFRARTSILGLDIERDLHKQLSEENWKRQLMQKYQKVILKSRSGSLTKMVHSGDTLSSKPVFRTLHDEWKKRLIPLVHGKRCDQPICALLQHGRHGLLGRELSLSVIVLIIPIGYYLTIASKHKSIYSTTYLTPSCLSKLTPA